MIDYGKHYITAILHDNSRMSRLSIKANELMPNNIMQSLSSRLTKCNNVRHKNVIKSYRKHDFTSNKMGIDF